MGRARGGSARKRHDGVVSVAMANLYSEQRLAEGWIGRELEWNKTDVGLARHPPAQGVSS